MKKCKSCQTEIDDKAKKCPHCQSDQRSWLGRHALGILIVWIVVGAIISSLTKNSGVSTNKPETTKEEVTTNKVEQAVEEVKAEPIKLTGLGQQATKLFNLEKGLRRFTLTNSGSGHFSTWLMDNVGNKIELLANDSGQPFNGSKVVQIKKAGSYLLDIDADSNANWTVTVE